jgi:LacI family repressor for deo operon, udp, cdd, tsx, nupC, and nupG
VTTIERVAEAAGVSTATVSRALSGKANVSDATRAHVREVARQLGYVASASASSLASGRTRNVGIVMPFLDSWFYTTVLSGAHQVLTDAGFDVTLYHLESMPIGTAPSEEHPRRTRLFDEILLRGRVDALLAVGLELTPGELDRLHSVGRPVVGIGGPLRGATTISVDDHEVARLATEHLLSLGHRDIAHIGGSQDFELDFHVPATRRSGFEDAMAAAGVAVDERLVRAADFSIAGGYEAARQLLGDPRARATAIFAASDEMAIGAILAARDMGRSVPSDLSVIGIDGHGLGEFFGLTTVTQFPRRQGERAAHVLLGLLDGSSAAGEEDIRAEYELVVRRSTAVPAS